MKATAKSVIIKVKKPDGTVSLVDYKRSTDKKLKKETKIIIRDINKRIKKPVNIYADF